MKIRAVNKWVGRLAGLVATLFVITPLIVVAAVSTSAAEYISFPWNEGFSLKWYAGIISEGHFISAAIHSLELAAATAAIAVAIGTLAAAAVVRYSFPGRGLVLMLGSSPLFVPQVLTGLAISFALSASGLASGFTLLLIGHVMITIPFVLRVVIAGMTDFNRDLERAAENLGATRFRAILSITLPQILPSVFAGAIMAAIVSIDNVALSIFLAGPGYEILPVYLFNYAENRFNGIAAAVAVCLIVVSIGGIFSLQRLVGLDRLFGGKASA